MFRFRLVIDSTTDFDEEKVELRFIEETVVISIEADTEVQIGRLTYEGNPEDIAKVREFISKAPDPWGHTISPNAANAQQIDMILRHPPTFALCIPAHQSYSVIEGAELLSSRLDLGLPDDAIH